MQVYVVCCMNDNAAIRAVRKLFAGMTGTVEATTAAAAKSGEGARLDGRSCKELYSRYSFGLTKIWIDLRGWRERQRNQETGRHWDTPLSPPLPSPPLKMPLCLFVHVSTLWDMGHDAMIYSMSCINVYVCMYMTFMVLIWRLTLLNCLKLSFSNILVLKYYL